MAEDTTGSSEAISTDTNQQTINPHLTNPTETFDSSHAAFVDQFGAIFTLLSCGIAGYQIL